MALTLHSKALHAIPILHRAGADFLSELSMLLRVELKAESELVVQVRVALLSGRAATFRKHARARMRWQSRELVGWRVYAPELLCQFVACECHLLSRSCKY